MTYQPALIGCNIPGKYHFPGEHLRRLTYGKSEKTLSGTNVIWDVRKDTIRVGLSIANMLSSNNIFTTGV